MASLNDLAKPNSKKQSTEDYFNEFFTAKNYEKYDSLNYDMSNDQKKAIKIMFTSKKSVASRVSKAFEYDPYCIEAMYVDYTLNNDFEVYRMFEVYYSELSQFPNFNGYRKYCFFVILKTYARFLIEIGNLSKAIKIQKTLLKLDTLNEKDHVSELAYLYNYQENADELYRLYLNYDFNITEYIYLLLTLIKNEEYSKAREVLIDMYDKNEYASYIDHLYDLKDDSNAQNFVKEVKDCEDYIASVPNFYEWLNENREKLCE